MATKAEVELELARTKADFESFKNRVRDRVVDAMDNDEVCRDGGNEFLDDFGLERPRTNYDGQIYANFRFSNFGAESGDYSYSIADEDNDRLCEWVQGLVNDALLNASYPKELGKEFSIELDMVEIDDISESSGRRRLR